MGLLDDFMTQVTSFMENQPYDYIGIGDDNTSYDSTQTGLLGANTHYEQMESGYPTVSSNSITGLIKVAPADAQFYWNEIVICTGTPGDVANRVVIPFGEKGNTEWELEITLTLVVA